MNCSKISKAHDLHFHLIKKYFNQTIIINDLE